MTEADRKGDVISYINSPLVSQQISELDEFDIHGKDTIEAIIEERNWLVSALHSQGNAVITADTNGNVFLVNRSAEKLTGWTEQEAIGRALREIFPLVNWLSLESFDQNVQKILKEGKVFEFTNHITIIDKNRKEHIISGSASPIHNEFDHIVGIVISIQDITEKCKIEEEMMKRQRFESIGVLASGIAHDFNNILTAILGNISLAKIDSHPKDILERLTETEKALNKAKYLTQQLLNFSKSGLPAKESTSISELLQDSINFMLSGSNIKCHFDMPDNLWIVKMDESQINQVIVNIIVNAIQAMPEGGTIRVCARNLTLKTGDVLSLNAGDYVRISIQDQGIGISEENLQKIFEPYFTTKEDGSGLGLAISFSIVKNHNGHIIVDSHIGIGTTFHVYLSASSEKSMIIKKDTENSSTNIKGKILVLDDDILIRELIDTVLRNFGYEVVAVSDGTEVIENYKSAQNSDSPFNAVIMDLTIPGGMGAKEAINILTQLDPDVKAIVSSGYFNDPVVNDFTKYGFKGAITKPYGIKELRAVLNSVIIASE
jgi:PAS domain S-box-containing protein